MPRKPKKELLTLADLKHSGWTVAQVRRFLGRPDATVANPYSGGPPVKLWSSRRSFGVLDKNPALALAWCDGLLRKRPLSLPRPRPHPEDWTAAALEHWLSVAEDGTQNRWVSVFLFPRDVVGLPEEFRVWMRAVGDGETGYEDRGDYGYWLAYHLKAARFADWLESRGRRGDKYKAERIRWYILRHEPRMVALLPSLAEWMDRIPPAAWREENLPDVTGAWPSVLTAI